MLRPGRVDHGQRRVTVRPESARTADSPWRLWFYDEFSMTAAARIVRVCSIGAVFVVECAVLAGCSSGPSRPTSSEPSTSVSATSLPAAPVIEPSGPVNAHPALLDEATFACRGAGASDLTLCAGTVDAEVWGLPLVTLSQLRESLGCQLGVDDLYSNPNLAGPNSTAVVAPGVDSLTSTAFLDLRTGPQLLTVPPVSGRYMDFQLLDMYTNTIADIGVLTDRGVRGTYAFVGPGWQGTLPKGVTRIDVPTPDAWLLGRTQVKGPADLGSAREIENRYALASLVRHGAGSTGEPSTLTCPAPASPSPTSLGYLAELEKDMAADPPAVFDGPVVDAMAAAGIAAGRTPEAASSDVKAEYVKALGLGAGLVAAAANQVSSTTSTGWARGAVVGSYGTDYLQRAYAAKVGLGLQVSTQAVYFTAKSARSSTTDIPLVGTHAYEIRFSQSELPPHGPDGFWSITLYNSAEFLVPNPIDRYSIGNVTPGLVRGADGSLTIVVSPSGPTETDVNWLPAPEGAFMLVLRVYDPTPQVQDGSWSPPIIQALR